MPGLVLLAGALWFILIGFRGTFIAQIEDDAVPAIFAHQRFVDTEKNLLPPAEFVSAVRT
jgi:hypothetical protein